MTTFRQSLKGRFAVLGVVVLVVLGALTARLWGMQVLSGSTFAAAAEGNRIREVTLPAARGRILDVRGRSLVTNRPVMAVTAQATVSEDATLVAQLAFDAATGLDIPAPNVTATVLLSALLAMLYAGLALAIAGFIPRPSLVLGLAITAAVAGYFVVALFPLNATLAPWRHVSPWDWAFGGDPLTDTTAAWRYLALAGPALGLAAIGALGFRRRDVRAA